MDWTQILAICGGITIVGGAGAWIYKLVRPAFLLERRVAKLEENTEKDYKLLQRMVEGNRRQNRMLFSIINHMIDGNNVEKMKETRDDLAEWLVK